MASRVGDLGGVARVVADDGVGAGAGVCVVAVCDVSDVGGAVAVVGDTLFPSPSSVDNLPSSVAPIRRVTRLPQSRIKP